ncbi:MAG: flagellar motor protein MotB [Acidimicrobiales bacterium]|nr:flagellar motor protein MotB [Acidimicrobiales bacterium]MCB9392748.1 flagellar motor protein MotB [Acidimicrobiaceae bacterium]
MSGGGHGGHGKKGGHHEEHEEHEEHVNHEAWVIPYADMLTLLMALFLVLFAIGRTDLEKFKKLAESFAQEFGGGGSSQVVTISEGQNGESPLDGGDGVLDSNSLPSTAEGTGNGDGTGMATPTDLQVEHAIQEQLKEEAQEALGELQGLGEAIEDAAAAEGLGDSIAFRFDGRGLILTVTNSGVLFDSGKSDLKLAGQVVLQTMVPALQAIPNKIRIEGHTDSVGDEYDNYELSADRALAVLRFLSLQGGFDERIELAGRGEWDPIADNATEEGRAQNRRVEIIVLSDISLDPALEIDA